MSTKNLARTVIEGGRTDYSRLRRRHTNAADRRRAHQIEHQLCTSLDPAHAYFPPREEAYRSFDDKLGPAHRWLRSQSGRPWDKVRSELFARFDVRTTAGRHVVFDHLLRQVRDLPGDRHRFREFWISPQGLLCHRQWPRKAYRAARRPPALPEPEELLRRWLGDRRVIEHGSRFYWLVPTTRGAFRQHHELDAEEARRFRALPAWFRAAFEGPLFLSEAPK
jgi:hypothetical protein